MSVSLFEVVTVVRDIGEGTGIAFSVKPAFRHPG